MIAFSSAPAARIVRALATVTAVLLIPSCDKDDESESSDDQGAKKTTPAGQHPGRPDRPESGPNTTKSGQRDGKPAAAASATITTASGLKYLVLSEGTGPKPGPDDKVTVHYHGTLDDGTVFDSSVDRNQPASFPVNGVIKGWIEGLQLMSVGSKYKFVIPPDLAYGERGAGGTIGPNQTLTFEVELLAID